MPSLRLLRVLGLLCLAGACQRPAAEPTPPAAVADVSAPTTPVTEVSDVHSFARPDEVRVEAMGFRWRVSFDERRLEGTAVLAVQRHRPEASLRLDTRELEITSVAVGREKADVEDPEALLGEREWTDTTWSLGDADPIMGRALVIDLPQDPAVERVRIEYRTMPEASGLQWLEPPQTAEGTHPFLYSQSQAIHARSWIPCQDTPGVRIAYAAEIEVESPLVALMAAERRDEGDASGRFRFVMPQPIPSYLIALAVGRLDYAELGPRTGVWAEPSVLPRARHELADMEKMLQVTEELYGPYRWGRYEVLVLPPAFPFGGMENPRLTFATPTILAGDRSLVALIAHELAHSWSGNLVTNATWSDLWLNEGFTVYIERRIVEALYGRERAEMEAALGRQDLEEELEAVAEGDEALEVDLKGRDPDEGLSDVPYEKGALFLRMLEETYGRDVFDPFLQAWFEDHAFTSVTTAQFERFLQRELLDRAKPKGRAPAPSVDAWIHGPGVPDGAPNPSAAPFAGVDEEVQAFVNGGAAKAMQTDGWTPHEWLHFLRSLPAELPAKRLKELDEAYAMTRSGNYEILAQWLELGVRHDYRRVDARLEAFLLEVGRRKFLIPLYRSLLESSRREDALRIYGEARSGYHPISQGSLDALIEPPR